VVNFAVLNLKDIFDRIIPTAGALLYNASRILAPSSN
jgi:hypothetical protein